MGYKKISYFFEVGEVAKNDNGYYYKVVAIMSKNEVKFERVKDGEIVEAYLPNMYIKDDKEKVLVWEQGKYYSRR